MLQLGKTEVLGKELERVGVEVCGLSEVRWQGQGHFTTREGHIIMYSGDKVQGQQGVAVWLNKRVAGALIGYEPVNSRIIVVRLNAKPKCISLIQVYAPTSTADEHQIEQFYEDLAATIKKISAKDILLVLGDFNAKVGGSSLPPTVGPYGLGEINQAGERLTDFCSDHSIVLVNTWFKHHPRRLYTWTSPGGNTRNQIDYIGIAHRWKSSISNCKTYPGADCDSDHHLLVATLTMRLGKKKKLESPLRLDLDSLNGEKAAEYALEVTNRFEALGFLEDEKSPNDLWIQTKEILLDSAEKTVGLKRRSKCKAWISGHTFELIDEKRKAKQTDPAKYKVLKKEVQKELRQDKQRQLDEMCDDLETANRRGNMRCLFRTVKSLTHKFQPQLHCIQSASGENITDPQGIAERWREYCEELYNDADTTDIPQQFEHEPPPLRSEVAKAIGDTASGKSTGPDNVPAELFKAGGETTLDRMHRICVALWKTGEWPDDWVDSTFITLPKKGDLKQCTNYRTIALVSHASKILLKIILERIRTKTEAEIADEQAGFRRGRGTRDQVTNLRIVLQKAREHQQPVYMCFVDFRKAFDSISHERLWTVMLEMGYPAHLVNLLAKLYSKQKAKVRVAGTLSHGFRVKRGVRQGCVLSPHLFNILAEMVMREALEGFDGGIQIGGRRVTNLRYADDIILLARSEIELQEMVDRLDTASKKYSLLINEEKTKTMTTNGTSCNIRINNNILEQVTTFPYLGSLITSDTGCSKDIRSRLAKGSSIAKTLKNIWQNHGIGTPTKIRLLKALVWPVATYGCESWTLNKDDETRINAFEMRCLRQVLRVSWTAKKTNEWVLKTAGVERGLLATIKQRKMSYYGHILRKNGGCLEKDIIQGTTPGSRARGRPRTAWLDNIKAWTGLTVAELTRKVEDRTQWKIIVRDAADPRIEDG